MFHFHLLIYTLSKQSNTFEFELILTNTITYLKKKPEASFSSTHPFFISSFLRRGVAEPSNQLLWSKISLEAEEVLPFIDWRAVYRPSTPRDRRKERKDEKEHKK
ncbi:hypothetical protein NPIL_229661 [Nephila pilipes]|uniref:Uncharacterized protein n=1 Tax=Nephila pilipes TaxID=299642 RepID=A0A8X6QX54_NEPPI|nr:hypothetical protein NPIL_229661 [Nephila pilipes]